MRLFGLFSILLTSQVFSVEFNFQETYSLAKNGDSDAQYKLGYWYGEERSDFENSIKWIIKAAEQNHERAFLHLGYVYKEGLGVPENDSEALKWLLKGATAGFISNQFFLGQMYLEGDGIARDPIKSYVWFSMAKTQSYNDPKFQTNEDFQKNTDKNIESAKKLMSTQALNRAQNSASRCWKTKFKSCD